MGVYTVVKELRYKNVKPIYKIDEYGNIYLFITRKDMEKLHIGNEKSTNKVVEFLQSNLNLYPMFLQVSHHQDFDHMCITLKLPVVAYSSYFASEKIINAHLSN